MLITIMAKTFFERICLGIVEPLSSTPLNNMFILTIQDELNRYFLVVALPSSDATTVAQAFVEFFVCIHGIPTSFLTDCGTNFL